MTQTLTVNFDSDPDTDLDSDLTIASDMIDSQVRVRVIDKLSFALEPKDRELNKMAGNTISVNVIGPLVAVLLASVLA